LTNSSSIRAIFDLAAFKEPPMFSDGSVLIADRRLFRFLVGINVFMFAKGLFLLDGGENEYILGGLLQWEPCE
jgi:hypothetical protein